VLVSNTTPIFAGGKVEKQLGGSSFRTGNELWAISLDTVQFDDSSLQYVAFHLEISMLISAEVRWFWHNTPPDGVLDWFCSAKESPCRTGGGELLADEYLRDGNQAELGVKLRGGNEKMMH
jgi:hypothetical protein